MTPESLAAELLRGLESGDVVLSPDVRASASGPHASAEAQLAHLCAELRTLVEQATESLNTPGQAASLAHLKREIDQVARRLGAA
ncbi:hypothetical protein C1280_04690 [Gemmata obscuriglobus]|uniref:Uncharacterized protein n=1 Tax=Gemmata obscuriglobus TaxID=114 RepID=A0A2Z3GYH4_9BACT|nr:hypothetical protein C1280_04690 [Gemmata obscuriglobus]